MFHERSPPTPRMKTLTLDAKLIEAISGHYDEALRLIEEQFGVSVSARGSEITISQREGVEGDGANRAANLLGQLAELHQQGIRLRRDEIKTAISLFQNDGGVRLAEHFVDHRVDTPSRSIVPKSVNQRDYVQAIREYDLVLGVGPAGTGKTYLAVALAVSLLVQKRVRRIVLCRPAVEAGERLGFLPGDIAAKVDPYLRPLYDALYEMLEVERTEKLLEQGVIEVAPLAFMRGRTLNHAFIILDEAQNSTSEQMKMFLTRIGLDSKAVVTGDVTQIDLPTAKTSGLVEARQVLSGVQGIGFVAFDERDVVRHPLVQRVIQAYSRYVSAQRERAGETRGTDTAPPAST